MSPPTYAVVVTQFVTHRPKQQVLVAVSPAHGEERASEVGDSLFSLSPRVFMQVNRPEQSPACTDDRGQKPPELPRWIR